MTTLAKLNSLPVELAIDWFEQCCASAQWCKRMAQARPYDTVEQVSNYAELIWQQLDQQDYLEAFEGHPMIGDLSTLKKKFAATQESASTEQAGTRLADDETLSRLKINNDIYFNKNGFIFIICASGLSATDMLAELEARINNTRDIEIMIAAGEQIKITLLRINKFIDHSLKSGD